MLQYEVTKVQMRKNMPSGLSKTMYCIEIQEKLVKTFTRGPRNEFLLSDVLFIRICLLHVHYYSKPNNAQTLVCIKQKFV